MIAPNDGNILVSVTSSYDSNTNVRGTVLDAIPGDSFSTPSWAARISKIRITVSSCVDEPKTTMVQFGDESKTVREVARPVGTTHPVRVAGTQ
jgi:hypothetical protein